MVRSWMVVVAVAVAVAVGSGCLATWAPPFPDGERTSALVLLDLQRDFLEEGGRMRIEASQVEPLVARVSALVEEARARGAVVVRVHNVASPLDVAGNLARNHAAVRGTSGAQADPRIPAGEDRTYEKQLPDAFTVPALDAYLRERGVTHVVIAGLFADQCVTWTTRGALNRRIDVTIVRDGVGAADADARDDALAELEGEGVSVVEDDGDVAW